ncbi:iron compound ABC transporter, permease protein [Porphyromonas gingivalis W83]|uniref:Iron compound ABC transporter, permease protein n=1 Tax=Porphyromonas gingivalis (strain ATCC BAA-308 / W83) TaxID=242619 RepID=Q7MWF0_PORGI|nr:iron ABC transporter permease [Porphyromonas gingivalis]AAQ65847.1 iron compound ABC transporter, permease protein [Porphyromonas gingivalis W83]AKV64484.1 ABC-type Fe3+-siderophore transport system, permease component [Porphyromonas gingivalis]AUR46189.1 hemin transport system permease protein [Porphyromonas gingivalis]EIW94670.1 iron chelate uptake ABC transporter, FeCT family, permease protein [Porphyromonas gingivalis W50]USI94937.1 iron ABC transporter permease [Porphyromonas gingivali
MTSVSHLRTISVAGILAALGGAVLILFGVNLFLGSVAIPMSEIFRHLFSDRPEGGEALVHYNILWKSRLPEALTAAFAGAGLSVSGLQMQTVFRNPLAGPSVLGISSGASLGVALVVLLSGSLGGVALSSLGYMGEVAMNIAAAVGSLAVMGLIVFVSTKVRSHVTLLIIGVMIGYVATAVIGVFKFFSIEEDIRAYVIWGLGSFSRATDSQLSFFAILMLIFIPAGMLLVKQLNLLLLGESYARNLGLNTRRARLLVISSAGLLIATVTAYCGPIGFLGMAVPHLARVIFHTSDHRILMPATCLIGSALALFCNIIARMPGFEGALPVNSVTALVGAPIIVTVLFRRRRFKEETD